MYKVLCNTWAYLLVISTLKKLINCLAPLPNRPQQEAPDFDTVSESDAARAQHMLLRHRAGSEEVLVSALPAPLQS